MHIEIRGFGRLSFIALTALCIVSCSKSGSDHANQAAARQSLQAALSPHTIEQAKQKAEQEAKSSAEATKLAALPKPDLTTADSDYVDLHSGGQLMFLYAANSGLPPDYEKLAGDFSSEYRSTSDSFRKHDLLEALKPKIDARIADAKAHPYVIWMDSSPELSHYDFSRKGFAVGSSILSSAGYGYMFDNSSYSFSLNNGAQFQFLPVADEALSRRIEHLVGQYNGTKLKIYAFAQSTDDSRSPSIKAQIVKLQLLDGHGQVLLEEKAK